MKPVSIAFAVIALLVAGCQSVPSAKNAKHQPDKMDQGTANARLPEAPANVAVYAGGGQLTLNQLPDRVDAIDRRAAGDAAETESAKTRPATAGVAGIHRLLVADRGREIENLASLVQP